MGCDNFDAQFICIVYFTLLLFVQVIRAPPTFSAEAVNEERHAYNLGNFQERLRDSRYRLENLMSNFSSELERSRQEMADFQVI